MNPSPAKAGVRGLADCSECYPHRLPGSTKPKPLCCVTQPFGGVLNVYMPHKPLVCLKESASLFYISVLVCCILSSILNYIP